jgi:hypothetical protein
MQRDLRPPIALALVAIGLAVSGCGRGGSAAAEAEPPVRIVQRSGESQVVLTDKAAKRIGVETATAGVVAGRPSVPYSAVIYTPDGRAWVYVSPEPDTFVRRRVVVARIVGDTAELREGPSAGTAVVTVGAEELFGSEFEFEE